MRTTVFNVSLGYSAHGAIVVLNLNKPGQVGVALGTSTFEIRSLPGGPRGTYPASGGQGIIRVGQARSLD